MTGLSLIDGDTRARLDQGVTELGRIADSLHLLANELNDLRHQVAKLGDQVHDLRSETLGMG